jgi:hypothetical protein
MPPSVNSNSGMKGQCRVAWKVRLEAFLNGLPTPVERELMQYQGLFPSHPHIGSNRSAKNPLSQLSLADQPIDMQSNSCTIV